MSAGTLIHSALLVSDGAEQPHAWVVLRHSVVEATGTGDTWRDLASGCSEVVDAFGLPLTPGLIDIHVHGGGGASFGDDEGEIAAGLAHHRAHGTTRSVVSLVTADAARLLRQLEAVRRVCERDPLVLGSHLEGPFLAPDFRGAHTESHLRPAGSAELDALMDIAGGTLRQVTLAPELPGATAAIEALARRGVIVAIGHTAADYDIALRAFDSGASVVTHAFNGMRGIHHRAPGPVAAALQRSHVSLELINDGIHVMAPVADLLFAKAAGRIVFVTDAMAAAGAGDGDYVLGGLDVRVTSGVARLAMGDSIAGSTLHLDEAVRRGVTDLALSLPAAVDAATGAPARALGEEGRLGSLRRGFTGDAVLWNTDLTVRRVWANAAAI